VTQITDGLRCANCAEPLHGDFCARCGQRSRDLRQPLGHFLREGVEDLFNLDTRFFRTIVPLLVRPGNVTRDYHAGRRASFVPPFRTYLVAALIFFGVFTLFPGEEQPRAWVVTRGSPEAAELEALRKAGKLSGTTFEVPPHSPFFDVAYQASVARAKANPQAFMRSAFENIPRTFFLLVPLFALLLELFYRKQGFYLEHLVFALYYHAFVFYALAIRYVLGNVDDWMWPAVRVALAVPMWGWILVYLPLALRRVYLGSWPRTLLKVVGLGVLYFPLMGLSFIVMMFVALARF
jgi:hypothetical protein